MTFVLIILVLSNAILFLQKKHWRQEAQYNKKRGLEFWKMYKDECEKNRWNGKFPGDKHEYGHDYE